MGRPGSDRPMAGPAAPIWNEQPRGRFHAPGAYRARGHPMDIRQLDMFRAVAEEGSFTRAAERLHVSQSAISRQVKLLEDELGGMLLHRGARRVALTHPGDLLLKM